MAKSGITKEQARGLIDSVAKELGLLVADTSGFVKIQGPGNRHRIYVQRSQTLGRIDCTLPTVNADGTPVEGCKGLEAPNGSVTCHLDPTLENLEFHLRRLADGTLATQVPNKPRPGAFTKAPARKPKAVAAPLADGDFEPPVDDGPLKDLKDRLTNIKMRGRLAKINRLIENDPSGSMTYAEAEAIVDGKTDGDSIKEANSNAADAELNETLSEAGIEVNS